MTGPQADPELARAAMVKDQLRARGITDERVLAAMGAVPREVFVPDRDRRTAYVDEALPIGAGQTISQPFMVARMTQDLEVKPGDRILEIGAGSGYQAAILAWLGAHVTSLERQAALIEPARERLPAPHPPPQGLPVRGSPRSPCPPRSPSAKPMEAWATPPVRPGTGSSSQRVHRPSPR